MWGLCLLSSTKFFFLGFSSIIYVVDIRVGDVCGLSFVGCCLCKFKISTFG